MLNPIQTYNGFSINDLEAAKQFYSDVLGLQVTEEGPGLRVQHVGGGSAIMYIKANHQPASYTVMNFEVENVDDAVEKLKQRGVVFERYDGMQQDELGIMRGLARNEGPDIAWFKDPAGNILSVLQEQDRAN